MILDRLNYAPIMLCTLREKYNFVPRVFLVVACEGGEIGEDSTILGRLGVTEIKLTRSCAVRRNLNCMIVFNTYAIIRLYST